MIFVTGAKRGVRKSLVKAVLEKGVKKVYAVPLDLSRLTNFKDSRMVTLKLNITDNAQILKVAKVTQDVQILINNSGV